MHRAGSCCPTPKIIHKKRLRAHCVLSMCAVGEERHSNERHCTSRVVGCSYCTIRCHVNAQEHERREEHHEDAVVAPSHTVIDPWAVMIEPIHTQTTDGAVFGATRLQHLAGRASSHHVLPNWRLFLRSLLGCCSHCLFIASHFFLVVVQVPRVSIPAGQV